MNHSPNADSDRGLTWSQSVTLDMIGNARDQWTSPGSGVPGPTLRSLLRQGLITCLDPFEKRYGLTQEGNRLYAMPSVTAPGGPS